MQNTPPIQNPTQPTPTPQPANTPSFTQTPVQPTPPKKKAPWLLISIIVLLFGATGIFAFKYLEVKQQLSNKQTTLPSPQLTTNNTIPTISPEKEKDLTTVQKTFSMGLYDLQFKAPTEFTIKEINRRSEPSGPEVNQRGHDCADYVLSDSDNNLNINFKPGCGFLSGGGAPWPYDAVVVKEFKTGYPKYIIRFFNNDLSLYEYSGASGEVQQGTPAGKTHSFPPIISFKKGNDLLFVYISASYNGLAESKEKYLKIADDIIASLERN